MAGRGPAPKHPSQRRNRAAPQRGEWHDLPPLEGPVLPEITEGVWSERTLSAWAAWRSDPATQMYSPADVQLAIDLAYVYEQWVDEPSAALASEIRQRLDGLGLSPKGKQDRRWRIAAEEIDEPAAVSDPASNVRRIRAVDPAAA